LLVDEDVCPAHREIAARAMPVFEDGEVTRMMGSHELDECSRPAEWAVDPGLADLLHYLEYGFVVSAREDILDDGAAGSPFDTGDCSPRWLRTKVNPGGDHRSTLLRQKSENHLLSCIVGGISASGTRVALACGFILAVTRTGVLNPGRAQAVVPPG